MRKILLMAVAAMLAMSCSCSEKSEKCDGDCANCKECTCGGFTQWRDVEDDEAALYAVAMVKYLASKTECSEEGCSLPCELQSLSGLVPTQVQTQVVAGINYRFKTGDYIVKIFKPLPGQGEAEVTEIEKAE